MAASDAPADIVLQHEIFDLAFHPSSNLVATANISGDVHMFGYASSGNELKFTSAHHTESCRSCIFSEDGAALYSVSADKSIQATDVRTGRAIGTLASAHSAPINVVTNVTGQGGVLATGDDNGVVKFWDLRQRTCVNEYKDHQDFISDIIYVADKDKVIASSGDGTISIMNWKHKKTESSYQLEDEPLSLAVIKNGKTVVCGTQEGTLGFYKWGKWEDISDRMVGHPKSIDTLVKIDEDTVVTGSGDGLLRLVSIAPHSIKGVVGEHEGFSVERIRMSGDGSLLGSCSHDKRVKFWNTSGLREKAAGAPRAASGAGMAAGASTEEDDADEWEDAEDDDDMAVDDDDDDDGNGFDYTAAARSAGGAFLSDL
eukprot:m.139274 g.139274  ORF g.139274 m.139274 type:complete len:371 (+) comp17615_c0_seq1:222-1334(+)